jgi:hypothetical protein
MPADNLPPAPVDLKVLSYIDGKVTLGWANFDCDTILIEFGEGNEPNSTVPNHKELKGASGSLSYTFDEVFGTGVTYVFKVKIGINAPQPVVPDPFESPYDFSPWTAIVWNGGEHILLYSQKGGRAFVAPMIYTPAGLHNGSSYQIGNWESDWTQITWFFFNSAEYFLLYKANGSAFVAPIVPGQKGPQNGNAVQVGGWETDWKLITAFNFNLQMYFLLYRKNGDAFIAPIVAGPNGPQNGNAISLGGWETDWAQIVPFSFNQNYYLLFYRATGVSFSAPLFPGPNGPQNGDAVPFGVLDSGYTQIRSFWQDGAIYLLLYKRSNGKAYTAPIVADASGNPALGALTQIGGWENDWDQIVTFEYA